MSDDYIFDDDIILDEDALAILDAEESKYFNGTAANVQQNQRSQVRNTSPPAKRRRTDDDGGWKHPTPGVPGGNGGPVPQLQKRSDSFYEGLPDISLAGDGAYGVYSQGSQPPRSSDFVSSTPNNVKNQLGKKSQKSTVFQQPAPAPVPTPAPFLRGRTPSSNQNRQAPRPPPQQTHTPNVPQNPPTSSNRSQPQQLYRQQPSVHNSQQQNPNQTRGPVPRSGSVPPQPTRFQNLGPNRIVNVPRQQEVQQSTPSLVQPIRSRYSNVPGGGGSTDKDLQDEVARLKTQLELVRAHGVIHIFRRSLFRCV